MSPKARLRRSLLRQRQAFDEAEWQARSQQLCQSLIRLPSFQMSRTILIYQSVRQEPDLTWLFTELARKHQSNPANPAKTWGLPRCHAGFQLTWHTWSPGEPLDTDQYGVRVPLATAPQLTPGQVDLILVPAVGCDRRGYRLGYGAGYYDRLLQKPAWRTKPTIGIVFDFALVAELPNDAWDCKLTGICTEYGYSESHP
ncbi:MAG: 5-formyltetrahydrofolate cyclo-ligase [Cyanobacteria bacterium P01_H01_bin.121]